MLFFNINILVRNTLSLIGTFKNDFVKIIDNNFRSMKFYSLFYSYLIERLLVLLAIYYVMV